MNQIIPKIKRIGQLAVVGIFALTLVPAQVGLAKSEPLDSGSALLMPNDVATLGYENYGVNMGSLVSWPQLMVELDPDTDLSDVETHGITSLTTLVLDPIVGEEESSLGESSFYSSVTTFSNPSRAETDFESVRAQYEEDANYEILDEDAGIGNDSLLFQTVEEWDSETTVTTVQITFQIGNVESEVAVWFYDEDEVDVDVVQEAAELVEGKLDSMIESGEIDGVPVPGLSMRTARYEGEDLVSGRSEYTILDGQAVMSATMPEISEMLQARVEEYGIQAEYTASLEFQVGDELSEYDPLLRPRVALFESANDAERYVEERVDDLVDSVNVYNVESLDVPEDAYTNGAIAAVTYETDVVSETFEMTRIYVQDGRYVYDISLAGFTGPDLDLMFVMLDDAIACGQDACADTLDPPSELLEYFDEQREYWATELDSAGS